MGTCNTAKKFIFENEFKDKSLIADFIFICF